MYGQAKRQIYREVRNRKMKERENKNYTHKRRMSGIGGGGLTKRSVRSPYISNLIYVFFKCFGFVQICIIFFSFSYFLVLEAKTLNFEDRRTD